jgi:hypothetical protein
MFASALVLIFLLVVVVIFVVFPLRTRSFFRVIGLCLSFRERRG